MPFLLCFSYRLYYQYIFIYFSASSSDKENSSIIFLITSSVNNSPFSFPADVADAGSRQPSSVDFTGPIYFTLSRNTEKPTAVPIITITAMMIQAGSSRFVGKIHALVKKKKYTSPNQHSPSCNREISFGISFESINVSQNYILPDCIQIAYEMHWQNGLDY